MTHERTTSASLENSKIDWSHVSCFSFVQKPNIVVVENMELSTYNFRLFAIIFTIIGLLGTGAFLVFELGVTREKKNIVVELLLALFSSVFLGFGTLFLLLWAGLYV